MDRCEHLLGAGIEHDRMAFRLEQVNVGLFELGPPGGYLGLGGGVEAEPLSTIGSYKVPASA